MVFCDVALSSDERFLICRRD